MGSKSLDKGISPIKLGEINPSHDLFKRVFDVVGIITEA